MYMDFREQPVQEWAAAVRDREVLAREMVRASLTAIDAHEDLNAFVAVDPERSLAEADRIDARLASGDEVGPLAGIPIGVKDLEDAAGYVTSHGSRLHAEDPPAAVDSVLVERLRAAGCVVMGKTNTPEFGWTGDTYNPLFGPTRNPWDRRRSPGDHRGEARQRWPPVWFRCVPVRTGAGRSAFPQRPAGSPGSSPAWGGYRWRGRPASGPFRFTGPWRCGWPMLLLCWIW